MQGRVMIEEPEAVQCTIKLTAPMSEWVELRDYISQMNSPGIAKKPYVATRMESIITDLVSKMRKVHYPDLTE